MGKATRSLSGAGQKKYFRDLLRVTEGLDQATAETLAGTFEREIAQVRVRLPIPDRGGKAETRRRGRAQAAKDTDAPDAAGAASSASPPAAAGFDPFAFSVVVVVTKEGREGLMQRLSAIGEIEHLRALAKAQHVALPDGAEGLDQIRTAIAEGALQRIANRRAAAS